jgi:hypothetical protein
MKEAVAGEPRRPTARSSIVSARAISNTPRRRLIVHLAREFGFYGVDRAATTPTGRALPRRNVFLTGESSTTRRQRSAARRRGSCRTQAAPTVSGKMTW